MLVQAFINVATGGFGTELTVKTDEGLKDKLGGAAYFVTGMRGSDQHAWSRAYAHPSASRMARSLTCPSLTAA